MRKLSTQLFSESDFLPKIYKNRNTWCISEKIKKICHGPWMHRKRKFAKFTKIRPLGLGIYEMWAEN